MSRWSIPELDHASFNICLFPPLFFFYGLYYTDVISAQAVLMAYSLFSQGRTRSFVFVGLCSLFFRQTNIFWVSVFFGGLKVCRSLATGRPGIEFPEKTTFLDVMEGSWQHSCIYNPLVSQAWFEGPIAAIITGSRTDIELDYPKSGLSIAIAGFSSLGTVLGSLVPHLFLLGAFGAFVIWNQGVVLGISPVSDASKSTYCFKAIRRTILLRSTFRKCSMSGRTLCSSPSLYFIPIC